MIWARALAVVGVVSCLSALGDNFYAAAGILERSFVRCPEYRGCPYFGGWNYIWRYNGWCHGLCSLYPHLGVSVIRGFTVYTHCQYVHMESCVNVTVSDMYDNYTC